MTSATPGSVGAERRTARPPLWVVVFVVGAASLGTEIAAARLLAPYFGASTIIWANTIAVVLLALSTGYWLGGRIADRNPDQRRLLALVMAAAVALAVVPFLARPFLSAAVGALDATSAGAFVGSLVAVLLLVAGPVLLLGAVAPFAIRLSVPDVRESGRVSGRLYAVSTAGSLAGTFLASLVLIPFAGTHRTFLVFAAALALVAAVGLRARWLAVAVGLCALIAIPPGATKAAGNGERVIWEAETPYQYARVVEDPAGIRRLELNEGLATHSLYRPWSYLTDNYWDEFLALPSAALRGPPRRIAILGNAAGTTARAYGHYFPQTRIDAVEIDGELTDVGRRLFDMRAPHLATHTADARPYLEGTKTRYDAILIDAYRQPYIPFYLATREFFALCRDRLAPGGVVVVNVGHLDGDHTLERALAATMRQDFRTVMRDAVEPTNTLLVATSAPGASARSLAARANSLPADIGPLATSAAARLQPALRGGEVLTDDRAPVEWLVDRSIVEYAARGGH
jgi:spermidine synthase